MIKVNPQIHSETTKEVRIDSGVHRILKIEATKAGKSIRAYLETVLAEYWGKEEVKWD